MNRTKGPNKAIALLRMMRSQHKMKEALLVIAKAQIAVGTACSGKSAAHIVVNTAFIRANTAQNSVCNDCKGDIDKYNDKSTSNGGKRTTYDGI